MNSHYIEWLARVMLTEFGCVGCRNIARLLDQRKEQGREMFAALRQVAVTAGDTLSNWA